MASQKARRPSSVDCSSAAIAARANKRRFVNLLQQLGGVNSTSKCSARRQTKRRSATLTNLLPGRLRHAISTDHLRREMYLSNASKATATPFHRRDRANYGPTPNQIG